MRCFLSYKDTHLKAIHNQFRWRIADMLVVFYLTKILIWKQFTTSQYGFPDNACCFLSYKDTHLKAIHNTERWRHISWIVVFYLTKILIWKQFTTSEMIVQSHRSLFSILQRYSFESNSQPCGESGGPVDCCFLSYKDTHLKAIHNAMCQYILQKWLFSILQRYSFESNSQLLHSFTRTRSVVFYLTKILIWKQFTTHRPSQRIPSAVVFYLTKILIWKQFTTSMRSSGCSHRLFSILQRYSFESNSQQIKHSEHAHRSCFLSYKDTHLKAIHNLV